MKRAAIYARVSTEEQKNNYSIGEQIEQITEYCERHDLEVKEKYIDPGFSGANINRPALQQLLAEVKDYDVIIVWKLDRLSRSIIDTMTIIERDLLAKGTQFVALAENINTKSSTWVTQAGIYSTIAQSEREAIAERMQMGRIARAKSGKPMSWSNVPFGYRYSSEKQTYLIDPIQGDVVRFMFNEYEKMGSITKLRNTLNENGHVGKSIEWSYRTVKQILDNPVYKGYNRYKGNLYKGNHEPLVEESLFEKVQRLMEERRIDALDRFNPRPFQGKYMLSGQLKCGYCGAPLEITRTIWKSGRRVYRYRCRNRWHPNQVPVYNDGEKCKANVAYYKEDLEEKVLAKINELQMDKNLTLEYSQKTSEKLSALNDYKKQLENNQKATKKTIDLYMADLISRDELNNKSENLKKEERYLKNQINDIENENNEALEYLDKESKNIYDLTYDMQKRAVEILIDKISITLDSMRITWNF